MLIHDISLTISPDLIVWPGDPPVVFERLLSLQGGDVVNMTHLAMSAHTGTHVDAPFHFIDGGTTVEKMPLEVLVGPCQVVTLPESITTITAEDLDQLSIPANTLRLLIKSSNSALYQSSPSEFVPDFVALDPSAARWILERGIRLVGIDYLSVAPYSAPAATHQLLLRAGIILLEGLDLSQVQAGIYTLCCLPLKLQGIDGAPARAVLIED